MSSKFSLIKITRYQEWWSCKLSPLLALGYGTVILCKADIVKAIPSLLFLIAALIVGALYASTINDISDIKEDLASGKSNRMSHIPSSVRWLFPAFFFFAGVFFFFKLLFNASFLSAFIYAFACISYTFYSLEPLRLKRREIWGVIADACGAHTFPGLLMVAGVSAYCGESVNWYWFAAAGIWSACFGLRGILWHQFQDKKNDLKVNLKTFAVQRVPQQIKSLSRIIIIIEIVAFAGMMVLLENYWSIPCMIFYIGMIWYRQYNKGERTGLVITDDHNAMHIFMLEYYILLFPASLLLGIIGQPGVVLILLVHLILFQLRPFYLFRSFISFVSGKLGLP